MEFKRTILVDSRQQEYKHYTKHEQLKKMGYKLMVSKLPIGDYAFIDNLSIVVDTKKDNFELFSNLTKDHVRFRNELIKAQENNIKLTILVEEKLPQGGLNNWKSPVWKSTTARHKKGSLVTMANPETMRKVMITMQEKYGVRFLFCDKSETGRWIVDILEGRR